MLVYDVLFDTVPCSMQLYHGVAPSLSTAPWLDNCCDAYQGRTNHK